MVDGVSSFSGSRPPQGVDPDSYAKQYAAQKGISVDEAKAELKAQFGDPQQQGGAGSTAASDALSAGNQGSSVPPEAWELQSLGIPIEVIQQGDNAIKQFADENNIQLPEKKQGSKLNFEG